MGSTFPHLVDFLYRHSLTTGLLLTLAGAVFMSLGSAIQKYSVDHGDVGLELSEKPKYRWNDPVWQLGGCVLVLGTVAHICGLEFAPASILAPANSFGLVANNIAASLILNEKVDSIRWLTTIGISSGIAVCASCSSPNSDSENQFQTHLQMLDSWKDSSYLVFLAVVGLLFTCVLVLTIQLESKYDTATERGLFADFQSQGHFHDPTVAAYLGPQYVPLSGRKYHHKGVSGLMEDDLSTLPTPPPHIGCLYGVLAGLIGCNFVLEVKELFAVAVVSQQTPQILFRSPIPAIVILFCIVSGVGQHFLLTHSMTRGDASLLVPPYYAVWTVCGTIGGFAKYKDHRHLSPQQLKFFLVGLVITLVATAAAGWEIVKNFQIQTFLLSNGPPVVTSGQLKHEELSCTSTVLLPSTLNVFVGESRRPEVRFNDDYALIYKTKRKPAPPLVSIEVANMGAARMMLAPPNP